MRQPADKWIMTVPRLTLVLAAMGTLTLLLAHGVRDALGFLAGAGLSYLSYRSWVRLAAALGDSGARPATGSALFLALRYVLIGVAIYAIIEGLGSTPGSLIVGLLVSFAALLLEFLWALWKQNTSLR